MERDIIIPFSINCDVPVEQLNKEIERQQTILNELVLDKETNAADIDYINRNLELLKEKKKLMHKYHAADTFDNVFKWILWVILVVYCISLLALPIWMILTSFKSASEYSGNKFGFPIEMYWRNYSEVIKRMRIYDDWGNVITVWDEAYNSIAFSFGSSFFNVFLTTCMAYVLSKYKFPGSSFLYSLGIVIMIVPIVGNLPSAMMVRTKVIPTYDNMLLTILTGPCTCFSGLYFLLLHGAFKSMPWDYAEAVFIDGGNDYTAFFKMYLPLILPTSAVMFILSFLGAWNDYVTFMMWLPSTPNLAYGLYKLKANSKVAISTTSLMAGFTLIVIPTVMIYIASQKLILSKFTIGGLKG